MSHSKDRKLLSFCIPTYNRANCIEQCVKKILEHTSNDIEVIVSDNASTDNTRVILERIIDPRLKYFCATNNEGYSYNLKRVLDEASGKFCFILSDEDEVVHKGVDELLSIIKKSEGIALMYGSIIEESGEYNIKYIDATYLKGKEALEAVAFKHQYMGGIIVNNEIYNRIRLKIPQWFIHDRFFPHEYISLLTCEYGNVKTVSEPIIRRHDFGNISYSGVGKIKAFQTPEGVFATFEDRVKIIDGLIGIGSALRERLQLRNFRLSIYTASIFCYHTTKSRETALVHNVKCEELNIKEIINSFEKQSKELFLNSPTSYSASFYTEVQKIIFILRFKCIFKKLYYSKVHLLVNKIFIYIRRKMKSYY